MLRRFESYGFTPDASAAARDELARVLRGTGRVIPEVLDSAVGRNRSAVGIDLVWEHAYERPEAYARAMCHPFHICVLDRYLLPENPECITASRRELGLRLLGYEIDGAPFRATSGVRRVVALRIPTDASAAVVAGFLASLEARRDPTAGRTVSVAAPNSMGLEWFPGGWTHVWEQAFVDEAAMRASLDEGATLLAAVMIDTVEVAEADAAAYVDAFERWYLPGATARGLELLGCWSTPAGVGEGVAVTTVFAVGTWADRERARNAAVLDPDLGSWLAARRVVMRSGRRRFAVGSSPPSGG